MAVAVVTGVVGVALTCPSGAACDAPSSIALVAAGRLGARTGCVGVSSSPMEAPQVKQTVAPSS